MPVHGADISHHQAKVNIKTAKAAGLRWLYHKATEGETFTDDQYASRRAAAAAAGLPFGAYHFARPDGNDAFVEARRFMAVADPRPGDLRPVLDLEVMGTHTNESLRNWAKVFVDRVTEHTGVRPIVYTPYDLGNAVEGCLIWRPRYNDSNTPPTRSWDIWQFSNGVFGVPNSFPGLGHVDLNTMRKGLRVAEMLIPRPVPEPQYSRVHVVHAPLQFSDSPGEHTRDIGMIFDRCARRGVRIIGGTEAGPGANNTSEELVRIGAGFGYRMWVPSAQRKGPGSSTDCWVGVREDWIVGDFWETGFERLIPGSGELYKAAGVNPRGKPRWGPKGLVWASWDSPLGRWTHGEGHMLTKDRGPGKSTIGGVDHHRWNTEFTRGIAVWGKDKGRGSALVTYGGDQNLNDREVDTFRGGPFTSLADELEKWVNTGHGPIDVLASFNNDGRVEAAYWRALNDRRFPLHVDHFLCEGGLDVKHLAT
jgi:GH25 family lysozyme M1 (1,4-beta-N-acetylmuramidase)